MSKGWGGIKPEGGDGRIGDGGSASLGTEESGIEGDSGLNWRPIAIGGGSAN